MNGFIDRALDPILSDPVSIGILALLAVVLGIGVMAGNKAQSGDKVKRRLAYARAKEGDDTGYEIGQSRFGDLMDDGSDEPSIMAKFLGLLSPAASRLPLVGEKDRVQLQRTLVIAGFRSAEALNLMLAAKLACGIVVGVSAYVIVISGTPPMATGMKAMAAFPVGLIGGIMAPEFYVKWRAKRRKRLVSQAVPDALDLLVICAEAGLTLETGLYRVSRELRAANPELALELATTEAELKVLPERRMALENLVYRTEAPEMASLAVTMNQAEKYGTSLSQALRTIASEGRRSRMLRIEEKAARLPALMSLPLMVFVLPPCGVIVGGPAMVRLMGSLSS